MQRWHVRWPSASREKVDTDRDGPEQAVRTRGPVWLYFPLRKAAQCVALLISSRIAFLSIYSGNIVSQIRIIGDWE